MIRLASCIAALSLSLAPALAEPEATETSAETSTLATGASCLRANRISGYNVIDDRHVLVQASTRSRTYMVTTRNSCRDLKFGQAIAIKTSGLDCVDKFAKIIPLDRPSASFPCFVKTVDRVQDRDAAEALINARAEAKLADGASS
ncbi:MAG: DUF6491 family protein [Pseudomonadota bacterium]